MYSRRSVLAAGGVGSLALTAGCLDFIRGNAPLEYTAKTLFPSEQRVEETGYDEYDQGWEGINEEVAGREIRAAGWTVAYTNELEIQNRREDAAVFAGITMPLMEVAGSPLNPLAEMDTDELMEEFGAQLEGEYDNIQDPEPTGESFELEILADDREIEEYQTAATLAGEELEIVLWITSFDHSDDAVVLLGGFPEELPDEGVNIELLMESVEHPSDREVPEPDPGNESAS